MEIMRFETPTDLVAARTPTEVRAFGFDVRNDISITLHVEVEEADDAGLRPYLLVTQGDEQLCHGIFESPLPLGVLLKGCVVDFESLHSASETALEEENPLLGAMKLLLETIISTKGSLMLTRTSKGELTVTLWLGRWKTELYLDSAALEKLTLSAANVHS